MDTTEEYLNVFMARACELAQRGLGSTSPNPPVGAVIFRGERTLGEGYHHVRGAPHAEVEAMQDARARGCDVRGATLCVSLEPCNHQGLTPPCSDAIVEAGIARVVIGAKDPNPKTDGSGIARLRAAGIDVTVLDDPWAQRLIEPFAVAIRVGRPYVTLKMAQSLDGFVAPQEGSYWLTGSASRERVRELRCAHDAVMIGAGTVRVDDPLLTVRPPHARARPYVRVVVCEEHPIPPHSRVLAPVDGYARTIVVAPAGAREEFDSLRPLADCMFVGAPQAKQLDLTAALIALKAAGISSALCEGGPTFASALLGAGFVDRLVWLVAPVLLRTETAIPVLAPNAAAMMHSWTFEGIERSGDDLFLTARLPLHV